MKYLSTTLLLFAAITLYSQQPNLLKNGSFENQEERHSIIPQDWINCGFPGESPPDVFSTNMNEFRVQHEPCAGNLFLHMVARDNNTYEQLGQELLLEKGKRYRLTANVAKAELTLSTSRITNQTESYTDPIHVLFSGGVDICQPSQIIHQTALLESTDWVSIDVTFEAETQLTYFMITASFGELAPRNGNVLVDNVKLTKVVENH